MSAAREMDQSDAISTGVYLRVEDVRLADVEADEAQPAGDVAQQLQGGSTRLEEATGPKLNA
eukprot:3317465-Pyramimonas_sp.AAC.1